MIHSHSKVVFHPLKGSIYPDDKGEYAMVRWDTDESIKTSKDVLDLVRVLSKGHTIHEAARELQMTVSEVIDILNRLAESGYIKQIDHQRLPDTAAKIKPWLFDINRHWFKWVISKPVLYISFIFIISGLLIGLFTPGYFPGYRAYFWTQDPFIVFLSIIFLDLIGLLLHELGHFVATKAVGGEAVMRFSNRFIYLVAETESYHLAVLPKSLRYLVYFAGMFVDFFLIATIYWIFRVADLQGIELGLLRSLMMVFVLIKIQSIVWQYNAYLQTDMYNFLSDYLNHDNLYLNTRKFISKKLTDWTRRLRLPFKNVLSRLLLNPAERENSEDLRFLDKHERFQVFTYSFILVSGLIFSTLQFLVYALPRDITFVQQASQRISSGLQNSDEILIFKSILLIIMLLYPYLLLLYMALRRRK